VGKARAGTRAVGTAPAERYRGAVDNRDAIGSWLSGPKAAAENMGVDFGYRGKRLGLPEEGPGSIASVGRRLVAVLIDWLLSVLIAYGLISNHDTRAAQWWALVVFGCVGLVFLPLLGSTPGKRLLRLRVVRLDTGGRLGVPAALVRTVLLVLFLPAVMWDRDSRGLHDKAARSVEINF